MATTQNRYKMLWCAGCDKKRRHNRGVTSDEGDIQFICSRCSCQVWIAGPGKPRGKPRLNEDDATLARELEREEADHQAKLKRAQELCDPSVPASLRTAKEVEDLQEMTRYLLGLKGL